MMTVATVLMAMALATATPVMAVEAEQPQPVVLAETKTEYTFKDVVDEIEYLDIEEDGDVKSVVKNVDYEQESYTLIVTYEETNDDGFDWVSVVVENGTIVIQGKGPGQMVAAEYGYEQFMEQ